jgi:hypothetical protein
MYVRCVDVTKTREKEKKENRSIHNGARARRRTKKETKKEPNTHEETEKDREE